MSDLDIYYDNFPANGKSGCFYQYQHIMIIFYWAEIRRVEEGTSILIIVKSSRRRPGQLPLDE